MAAGMRARDMWCGIDAAKKTLIASWNTCEGPCFGIYFQ